MGHRKTKRGRSARNARSGLGNTEPVELVKAPHSFVINSGKLGKNANALMLNFRKIMEPFTASQLKVQKRNVLKDFVHMAGPLNVTHLIKFTKSSKGLYLRTAKLPRGPTLTYQIKKYSLIRDIVSSQKKSLMYDKLFDQHPLLVLNNFTGEGMHFKLMATMFQNMFPSINVNKTNLNTIRRCLLLNYNNDETIDMRQYAIKIVPTGVSKAVRKIIQSKVPNLSQYQDVDEFLQKSGNLSESDVEFDTASNTVVLPQPISSRGNIASEKSAIRMYEIGPRMTLKLIKIEDGLMTGEVMYQELNMRNPEVDWYYRMNFCEKDGEAEEANKNSNSKGRRSSIDSKPSSKIPKKCLGQPKQSTCEDSETDSLHLREEEKVIKRKRSLLKEEIPEELRKSKRSRMTFCNPSRTLQERTKMKCHITKSSMLGLPRTHN